MNQRPNYPPLDVCQMAMELSRMAPGTKPYMTLLIDLVKRAEKVAAPFAELNLAAPVVDEDVPQELRVPNRLMMLNVTVAKGDKTEIVSAVWVPANSEDGKRVNRFFRRPDIGTSTDFHWVLMVNESDRFWFLRKAACVLHRIEDTVMAFAPYHEMVPSNNPEEEEAMNESTTTTAVVAMAALLQHRSRGQESILEETTINCDMQPTLKIVQNSFGPIDKHTWDMSVVLKRDSVR